MSPTRTAAALLLSLLLAACASAPPVPPVDWEQQRAQLAALDHFTASGKIALRSADQSDCHGPHGRDAVTDLAPGSTWDIPLGALVYWLKGIPAPGMPVEALQFGPQGGPPVMLRQDGWTVRYSDFANFQGYTLPTRLEAEREDSSARIILREWRDLSAHEYQP